VNVHAEIVTFVSWMREHGFHERYDSATMLDFQKWFAAETGGPELAPVQVLTALGEHPAVRRTRARLKDSRGRVIKLPSGTPARAVFYHIAPTPEPQAAEPKAPAIRESVAQQAEVQCTGLFAEAA
jgi:hypothetical protein